MSIPTAIHCMLGGFTVASRLLPQRRETMSPGADAGIGLDESGSMQLPSFDGCSLAPPRAPGSWPVVDAKRLEIVDVEPLRAEIVSFFDAARDGSPVPVSGSDGRNALSLALRTLDQIRQHSQQLNVEIS